MADELVCLCVGNLYIFRSYMADVIDCRCVSNCILNCIIRSVDCWTLNALNGHNFAYVAKEGRGYQALTLAQICSENFSKYKLLTKSRHNSYVLPLWGTMFLKCYISSSHGLWFVAKFACGDDYSSI